MSTPSFDRDDTNQVRAALDAELPRLRAFLRHLLPPADADDVAQDVCLEVLRSPGVLLRGDNPGAYLRGIVSSFPADQLFTRRDSPGSWKDDPILAATQSAYLPDHASTVQEGWIRVNPNPTAADTSSTQRGPVA